jgi:uncharacterized MnhB-related membrane protein
VTEAVLGVSMTLVALLAAVVVRTRDPVAQVVPLGLYGMALTVLFAVLQAPDVALSQAVVGVIQPLLVLLALAKAKGRER